ncbi:hypothetical protein L3049_10260 [Labilibaculum sp. DW002]|uniref:SHOCT domain-containing protein n=1 Tax=Paralabilibaculum antarcticum TaxID=2912572 RepID=A0ABT5VV49_9BACT|nr:hypothetical protein [Labilibaculum sp. DW002]MDE5418393.1 hypothetical protein [Labilibaculum sp. DW002]
MRQLLILLLIAQCSLCYSQNAEFGKLSKKGSFTEYLSKNGNQIKVGDTLVVGLPSANTGFNYISENGEMLSPDISGTSVVIKKLKAYGEKWKGFKIYVQVKGSGLSSVLIDYESALVTGEIKNPKAKLTRTEAINKLKEAKELLDLEVIGREEYNTIKNDLTPLILN